MALHQFSSEDVGLADYTDFAWISGIMRVVPHFESVYWTAVVNTDSVYEVRVVDVGVLLFSVVSTIGLAAFCLRVLLRKSWDATVCRHGVSLVMGSTARVANWRVMGGMVAVFALTLTALLVLGAMVKPF